MRDKIVFLFQELLRNFRFADAADILIIAVLIYWALWWLRDSVSRPILVVVALLTILYLLAESFGLFLTSIAFQSLFTVLALALIVVFQDEVKRSVQRLTGWCLLFGKKQEGLESSLPDLLGEVAFGLSEKRFGALLVLTGKEAADRHFEGGTLLNGKISAPLLYSLFDPGTPGHDGAVTIVESSIKKFGVQLPLAKNRDAVGDRGTRHRAAVGISESTDALVIVVSEETGTVSVAHHGTLVPVDSPLDLKNRVENFDRQTHTIEQGNDRPSLISRNRMLKLTSLSLACLAWFSFAFHVETVERTFVVPIEYRNVSENIRLGPKTPTEAKATLSGSEREFLLLKPGNLKFSLDLTDAKQGRKYFPITDKQMNCPPNLSVNRIEPSEVRLEYLQ